jgi:hypothetical protein
MPGKNQKTWVELSKIRQEIIAVLADEKQTRRARLRAEAKFALISEQLSEAFQRECLDPTSMAYAFRNAKSAEDLAAIAERYGVVRETSGKTYEICAIEIPAVRKTWWRRITDRIVRRS